MKLKNEFEVVSMGDDIMAVPVGEDAEDMHCVIRLNESAAEIFEMLKEETSEAGIIDSLAAKYENDKEELTGYVKDILKEFKESGILCGA